jgi:hypothetical protein
VDENGSFPVQNNDELEDFESQDIDSFNDMFDTLHIISEKCQECLNSSSVSPNFQDEEQLYTNIQLFLYVIDKLLDSYDTNNNDDIGDMTKSNSPQSVRTFNMHKIIDTVDQLLIKLSEEAGKSPEIQAALESIMAAKQLINAYSKRLIDTPDVLPTKASPSQYGRQLANLMNKISGSLNDKNLLKLQNEYKRGNLLEDSLYLGGISQVEADQIISFMTKLEKLQVESIQMAELLMKMPPPLPLPKSDIV